jgi:hypothetical protein
VRRRGCPQPLRPIASVLFTVSALSVFIACTTSPRPAPPSPLENMVLRANQAPVVGLLDVVSLDTLVGKRVRVLGWCASAPGMLAEMMVGRRSGAWILATADTSVEVRGLVPSACAPNVVRQTLVQVFAQVVKARPHSRERLLLRLPD